MEIFSEIYILFIFLFIIIFGVDRRKSDETGDFSVGIGTELYPKNHYFWARKWGRLAWILQW
jgi:hypothetical protein